MLDSVFIAAPEKTSKRLMVVLHGLGDSIEGYRWLPPALRLSRQNYVLVNAPDDYYGGFSWYEFQGDAKPGVERSRTLLFELLDELRERGFPTQETTLFGFSQGCLMTIEAGCRYPHKLAGLIGISGYAHEPESLVKELSPLAREQRFLVTHGTTDPLIPIEKSRKRIEFLQNEGLQIEWMEFQKAHTIAGEEELTVIRKFVDRAYGDSK